MSVKILDSIFEAHANLHFTPFDMTMNNSNLSVMSDNSDIPDLTLLTLPQELLEKVLSYLTYDEICSIRLVCKFFNVLSQRALNKGFTRVDRLHSQIQREVKSKLPRRESERRNHPLARHVDILAAIETRLSLLSMTYTKYMDLGLCCFVPGRVLDEILRVLRDVRGSTNPPRAHELLQELRDISSMAMEHFDEKIVPQLKNKLPASHLPFMSSNSLAHSSASTLFTGSHGDLLACCMLPKPVPPPMPSRLLPAMPASMSNAMVPQADFVALRRCITTLRRDNVKLNRQQKATERDMATKLTAQEAKLAAQEKRITEQSQKIAEQERALKDVNRRMVEHDRKLLQATTVYASTSSEVPARKDLGLLKPTTSLNKRAHDVDDVAPKNGGSYVNDVCNAPPKRKHVLPAAATATSVTNVGSSSVLVVDNSAPPPRVQLKTKRAVKQSKPRCKPAGTGSAVVQSPPRRVLRSSGKPSAM